MQVDVGQQRRNNAALRCAAVGFVVLPILQITGFQKFVNQLDNTGVLDFAVD